MTYKEKEKQYCLDCNYHIYCLWFKQERYSNCIGGQSFMSGWESGQKDTLEEIEKTYNTGGAIAVIELIKELKG